MNDFWNDPPEDPDIPLCPECDIEMDVEKDGTLVCPKCKTSLPPPIDIDPPDPPTEEELDYLASLKQNTPLKCRHGKKVGECDTCDYESDIAYDSWRERGGNGGRYF